MIIHNFIITIQFLFLFSLVVATINQQFHCNRLSNRELFINSVKQYPDIVALILARGGSKGIRLKNLAKINGQTLVERSLFEISKIKLLNSIWVSTDNAQIAQVAQKAGANIHWRKAYTATDNASSLIAVQEFLNGRTNIDILALVQCTSPFLKSKYLLEAIEIFIKKPFIDCVFSVTRNYNLRWKEINNQLVEINFDKKNRPRRQDFEDELIENGMFYFSKIHLINNGYLQNNNCYYVSIPEEDSLDIDNKYDLLLAEIIASTYETS